jgi:hypothetical protein
VTDTPPEVEQRYRQLLLERSGSDRLRMGCSMHAAARALVRAAILADAPRACPGAIRRALFLRFYGCDFDEADQASILMRLRDGAT